MTFTEEVAPGALDQVVATELDEVDEGAESSPPRERRRIDLLIPGLVLTVVGLSLVLFLAYVFAFTDLRHARAQHQAVDAFTTPAGVVALSGKLPPNGTPAAVLKIPAIGVSEVVLQGSSPQQTAMGPGIMTQAARPGTIGNAVIVGRRTTAGAPFAKLSTLKLGDKVFLANGLGKFTFVVIRKGTATPGQVNPASPVNRPQLTLVTASTPLGGSGLSYVVARQVTAPGVAVKPHHKPTSAELGLSGYPGAVLPSILLGLLYVALIAGTVIAYVRHRRHLWTIYVLTTPIILAVALWWFENLYLLLPSTCLLYTSDAADE